MQQTQISHSVAPESRLKGILILIAIFCLAGFSFWKAAFASSEFSPLSSPGASQPAQTSTSYPDADTMNADGKRFEERFRQYFDNGGVLIVWRDRDSGCDYLMARNGSSGAASICPLIRAERSTQNENHK